MAEHRHDEDQFHFNETFCDLAEAAHRNQDAIDVSIIRMDKAIKALNEQAATLPQKVSSEVNRMLSPAADSIAARLGDKMASVSKEAEKARATYMRAAATGTGTIVAIAMLCFVFGLGGMTLVATRIIPDAQELQRLRTEKNQLENTISLLEQKGGLALITHCETPGQKSRLCIRIDERAPSFGSPRAGTYRVVYGY